MNAVFNSIAEIAGGNIGKAVAAVENSLVTGVPVAISFLANLIGLGGIAKKVQEIIKQIRKPIDKVVGKVVGFVVGKAKQFIGKLKRPWDLSDPQSLHEGFPGFFVMVVYILCIGLFDKILII